jgi:peptide/nickel transport system permease protein
MRLIARPVAGIATLDATRDPAAAGLRSTSDRVDWVRERLWSAARRGGTVLLTVIPIAFISTSICYGLLYLSPVNAAAEILGDAATPAKIRQLALALGSNRPYLDQYWTWLTSALHGNLGDSYLTHLPVSTSIMQRIPVDLSIGGLALGLAIVVGFGAGIVAALNRGKPVDRVITWASAAAQTMPEFWIGILLIVVFAVQFHVLPATGYIPPSVSLSGWLQCAILPAVSLCLLPAAGIARQVRTSLVGSLSENFIVGATVRGLRRRRVIFRHALRHASGPAVTVIGLAVPTLIGGAIIAEQVFGLPGIGQFALQGAEEKDMPVIQGVLLFLIVVVLTSNVLVNIILGWLRPEASL